MCIRDSHSVERGQAFDLLQKFGELPVATVDEIQRQTDAEVADALRAAAAAPWPDKGGAYTDIQDTGAGRWLG